MKKYHFLTLSILIFLFFSGCKIQTHIHTYSDKWSGDAGYHWHSATCEHQNEISDYGKHSFGDFYSNNDATTKSDGTKTRTCNTCGYKETVVDEGSKIHVHTFSTEWTIEKDCHYYAATCGHTDERSDYGLHEWNNGTVTKTATEETEGVITFECTVCHIEKEEEVPLLDHVHTIQDVWSSDDDYHWHKASCGKVDHNADENEHDWVEGDITTEATEDAEGERTYNCSVCNRTKTEPIAKLPHTHKFATSWTNNETKHWHAATCEHTDEKSGLDNHKWVRTGVSGVNATYECSVCQSEKTESMFCETVEKVGTTTVNGKVFDVVTFGMWPQTVKKSDVTVNESKSFSIGNNKYYLGSDLNYYIKTVVKKNTDSNMSEKYADGTTIVNGATAYFKVEPIRWIVLTKDFNSTGKALLQAERCIIGGIYYNENNVERLVSNTQVYGNNYKYSYVRAYLNGISYTPEKSSKISSSVWTGKGFLQTAFTSTAQNKIATTTVQNDGNSTTDSSGSFPKSDGTNSECSVVFTCDNTKDKVFMLSISEATTSSYGFGGVSDLNEASGRMRKATDYIGSQGAFYYNYNRSAWFLYRSPYYKTNNQVYRCGTDGGFPINAVDYGGFSICPAITIDYQ